MGKNKRRQLTYVDVKYNKTILMDSNEEIDFYDFCLECEEYGIIEQFEYQPCSWILSDRKEYIQFNDSKNKKKFLIQDHIYSPDFKVTFNKQYVDVLMKYFKLLKNQIDENGNPYVYIDIKGTFQRFGGDRAFSVNVKWVFEKYGLFVQKVVPKECFVKLGVPQSCIKTRKTGQISKKYVGMKSIPTSFNITV